MQAHSFPTYYDQDKYVHQSHAPTNKLSIHDEDLEEVEQYRHFYHDSKANKNNIDFMYEAQKIIMNDAEEDLELDQEMIEHLQKIKELSAKKKEVVKPQPQNQENEMQYDLYDEDEFQNEPVPCIPRWQILYMKAEESKAAKEAQRIQQIRSKDEDPECTFKPKLLSSSRNRILLSQRNVDDGSNAESMYDRNLAWKSRRNDKLKKEREIKRNMDLSKCTFKPMISGNKNTKENPQVFSDSTWKGVDQHLRRQFIAKQLKDEKAMLQSNPSAKLLPNSYKKDVRDSISRVPSVIMRETESSQRKTYEPSEMYTPSVQEFEEHLPEESEKPERLERPSERPKDNSMQVDASKVSNMKFSKALEVLHRELYNFKIDPN